jgi:hypothetical protein
LAGFTPTVDSEQVLAWCLGLVWSGFGFVPTVTNEANIFCPQLLLTDRTNGCFCGTDSKMLGNGSCCSDSPFYKLLIGFVKS